MAAIFENRFQAGRFLAVRLEGYAHQEKVTVLALPRGGVPVGYEIARALDLPLDVFLVRKLGVPGHEELAMGAIASGGLRVLNEDVIAYTGIKPEQVEAVAEQERRELERREGQYRKGRPPLEIEGQGIILVDDGLATGASMRAAATALRQRHPAFVIVAVPVGSAEICSDLRREVDEVICGETPEPFHAVGLWYSQFKQVSDEEVTTLLNRAAAERGRVDVPAGHGREP